MWVVNNQTPFAAERTWVRDRNGAEVWLVAVKATFDIRPEGILVLADEQEPVVLAPEFSDDPQCSGLLYDTDLPHRKAATDVLLFGHAYAPLGKPVKTLKVGFRVGPVAKELQVTGDRWWLDSASGVVISDTNPFVQMPITWERAYGGMDLNDENPAKHDWDLRNPAGCGFTVKGEHLIGKPVPNIEMPGDQIRNWRQRPEPAGCGPIAGHWRPRRDYIGTYDEHWEKTRQPLLPEDFDERYYHCAPPDQQVPGFLKGGEPVELYNLTPEGVLRFRLPRISFAFTTHFDDATSVEHRPVLHTVILRPDFPRVICTWHSHLECHHKVLKLSHTVVRVKQRALQSEKGSSASMPV
jgi:hypothetical protein